MLQTPLITVTQVRASQPVSAFLSTLCCVQVRVPWPVFSMLSLYTTEDAHLVMPSLPVSICAHQRELASKIKTESKTLLYASIIRICPKWAAVLSRTVWDALMYADKKKKTKWINASLAVYCLRYGDFQQAHHGGFWSLLCMRRVGGRGLVLVNIGFSPQVSIHR